MMIAQSEQEKYFNIMCDEKQSVTQKYMGFYHLKSIGGLESAELLKKGSENADLWLVIIFC